MRLSYISTYCGHSYGTQEAYNYDKFHRISRSPLVINKIIRTLEIISNMDGEIFGDFLDYIIEKSFNVSIDDQCLSTINYQSAIDICSIPNGKISALVRKIYSIRDVAAVNINTNVDNQCCFTDTTVVITFNTSNGLEHNVCVKIMLHHNDNFRRSCRAPKVIDKYEENTCTITNGCTFVIRTMLADK
jgi:hypothetical protein